MTNFNKSAAPVDEHGRAYHELQPLERAALARRDRPLYQRMRAAWLAAGSPAAKPRAVPVRLPEPAQTYRDLKPAARAQLSRENPRKYAELRTAWLAAGRPTPPEAA